MSTDEPTPEPYRPPAPGEVESPTRVCPDCITDPEHHSEGGVRPIAEFRVITGKAAARYKDGKRYAAYCRYHEKKRDREAQAERRRKLAESPPPPARQEELRKAQRVRDARKRKSGRPTARLREQRKQVREGTAPPEVVARIERERAGSAQYAADHAEARKQYRAAWYQAKVDKEIAEGKRPPRGTPRNRGGRPRRTPKPETPEE